MCDVNGLVLWNSYKNIGTSFTKAQRDQYGIRGLLPAGCENLEQGARRVMCQLESLQEDIQKYELLHSVAASSQALFYKVLIDNMKELLPIVYTPTVGLGCQLYDRIYNHPLGMYFCAEADRSCFEQVLSSWPGEGAELMVITDGGRILGLGDLGINGMGISQGKISLYCAGAGFHPDRSIPACIDCGTDNVKLRADPFYLGLKTARMKMEELVEVVDDICMAVKHKYPGCLIQFEDFETDSALAILHRMRERVLCFNDDIQGTAAVVLSGVINATTRVQHTPINELRVVIDGAGSSAVGVANLLVEYIAQEAGVDYDKAREAIYMLDSKGLITASRGELPEHKRLFARKEEGLEATSLLDVIHLAKPQVLIGLTGHGPTFHEEDIKALCQHCPKPLIMPLSNPTSKSEITAEDAVRFSDNQAVFASGSPFPPVMYKGATVVPRQANNVLVFPGLGLGAVAVKAERVTDKMLLAAAAAVAQYVCEDDLNQGSVYPLVEELRAISVKVASAVARCAIEEGLAHNPFPTDEVEHHIRSRMWSPEDVLAHHELKLTDDCQHVPPAEPKA